jgi:hypothetical protein
MCASNPGSVCGAVSNVTSAVAAALTAVSAHQGIRLNGTRDCSDETQGLCMCFRRSLLWIAHAGHYCPWRILLHSSHPAHLYGMCGNHHHWPGKLLMFVRSLRPSKSIQTERSTRHCCCITIITSAWCNLCVVTGSYMVHACLVHAVAPPSYRTGCGTSSPSLSLLCNIFMLPSSFRSCHSHFCTPSLILVTAVQHQYAHRSHSHSCNLILILVTAMQQLPCSQVPGLSGASTCNPTTGSFCHGLDASSLIFLSRRATQLANMTQTQLSALGPTYTCQSLTSGY